MRHLSHTQIKLFVLVCVLLGGMGQGVVAPQMPELLLSAEALRTNQFDGLALSSGLSATLMYLGIFLSTYRYGRLADLGRVHWLLSPGLLLYCASLLFLSQNQSFAGVFVARFIEGLALSAIFVAADYALGRLSETKHRARWLSYYGVAISIGLLLGPLLALVIAKNALWIVAFCAVALALVQSCILKIRIAVVDTNVAPPKKLNFGARASGAAYGYMEAGLVAVFPVVCIAHFKMKPEYCLVALIVSAAVFSVIWGSLADKFGARRIVCILLIALGFSPLLLLGGISPHTAIAASIFFGCLAGGMYPVAFSWLLESLSEAHYGYASGSFARAYGMGSLAGPLLVGVASQYYGVAGLFFALALAGVLGSIAIVAQSRKAG